MTDVGPQRQARAATKGFEFPPHIEATPLYSSTLGASARVTVVSVTCGVGAPTVVSFTVASNRTQAPIGVEGRPLAQMRRVGKRLPDFFRRVAQFADENERPLVSVLSVPAPRWPDPVCTARDRSSSSPYPARLANRSYQRFSCVS